VRSVETGVYGLLRDKKVVSVFVRFRAPSSVAMVVLCCFSIKAAICSVFPPAPAQVSTTRIPGLTSRKQLIVNWHLELQKTCLNTSVMKTLALSFKTKAWVDFLNIRFRCKSIRVALKTSFSFKCVYSQDYFCRLVLSGCAHTFSPNSLTPNSSIQSG
jgi:hypothetical protein